MDTRQAALWQRIDSYEFDDSESTLTFTARLARDNSWSPAFAKRALQEYKKFLLLAITAGHPVTPSDEVDQVWHLHLLYTRSYWEDFSLILGRPLHHGPTKGGVDEGNKFYVWYENTLCSYARIFATEPPPDIWPDPARRFGETSLFRRINTHDCWVMPKLRLNLPLTLVAAVLPLMWLAGCKDNGGTDWVGIFLFLIPIAVMLFAASSGNASNKKKDGNDSGAGCGGGDGGSGCGAGGGCGGGCGGG